ncbi:hypothetical protein [Spirosoma areae]
MSDKRHVPLMWLVNLLLLGVGLFLHFSARGQSSTRCDTLEHDRPILDRLIALQDRKLGERGQQIALLKIRVGLSDSTATEIRKEANQRIVTLTQQRDEAAARANRANVPKTFVGKVWQGFKLNVLAPIGGATLVYVGIKLIVF